MSESNKREIMTVESTKKNDEENFDLTFSVPKSFAAMNRLILKDLNANNSSPTFSLYTKDQITGYLKNPSTNEKNIRNAVTYIYGASSHFRRLIQYFTSLSDLAYVVSPCKIDTSAEKPQKVKKNYQKVINTLSSMNIKNQFEKVITVCLKEDTFYGTMHITNDNIIIQQLPPDYCKISVIENGVANVSFDFSYFDSNSLIDFYPTEFNSKYNNYLKDRTGLKWQELDSPTSFAVKCNKEILDYSLPPFVGILREVYDLEDYKQLRLTKTEIENYAMLVMKLGVNADGEWEIDFNKAKKFWSNLDGVLPDEIGSVLSPMDIEKISFEKNNNSDTQTVADAEQNLFSAAGVSSLLFNNDKASSNALLLSIKADQALTYGIVKSIEDVINRYIQSQGYGKNFKVKFLDCSPWNRNEMGNQYLKACQSGLPMISYYAASQGMSPEELDCMNFLENSVLNLVERFEPLKTSSTRSASETSQEGGRPQKSVEELTDSGEKSKESGDGNDDM